MGNGTWFKIPGQQDGERSLDEQMRGLGPVIAEVQNAYAAGCPLSVFDLGCAEGCISFEFMRAGATVEALDCNAVLLEVAEAQRAKLPEEDQARVVFRKADLRDVLAEGLIASFDIVLALAVVHKLPEPEKALGYIARAARSLVVIRLPGGSKGEFRSKGYAAPCNVNATMPKHGFELERTEQGPRDELVQYYRRR